MTQGRMSVRLIGSILLASCCGLALADDPLGFYLGGAVGQSHVRADEAAFYDPTDSAPLGFN